MNALFVAGTDTGVGKTVVTQLLASHLARGGLKVATQKWVETGNPRSGAVLSYKLPASPHLAAKAENKRVDVRKIKKAFTKLSRASDLVIVEGTGGLLVPLTEKTLLIDVVKALGIPVLLVAANRLGAINHTLLSLEALRARKMKVVGVIFNSVSKGGKKAILDDNPRIVGKIAKGIPVGILPYSSKLSTM